MKVFKMNEIESVAAHSEEEAKEFYQKFVGLDKDDVEETFEGEVSLNKKMYVGLELLTEEERTQAREWKNFGDELLTPLAYKDVIKRKNEKAPYVISSTEW